MRIKQSLRSVSSRCLGLPPAKESTSPTCACFPVCAKAPGQFLGPNTPCSGRTARARSDPRTWDPVELDATPWHEGAKVNELGAKHTESDLARAEAPIIMQEVSTFALPVCL